MLVACLHTAASNIALFDAAAHEWVGSPMTLNHMVMPQLLMEAEASGGMTQAQQQHIARLLHSLTPWFDVILITCSTIGAVADTFPMQETGCRVYRTDRMLADRLHQLSGPSRVLCAAPSTLTATRALFCPASLPAERQPTVHLVPDAWDAFKAGEVARYYALIRDAVQQSRQQGAKQVALAQVSMAAAIAEKDSAFPVLTIPALALQALLGR